jgi:citrate lyase subunit beta/citryl-CoA lyase
MFVLHGGRRFVIPRTEMTYPGHNPKLHQNAADPVKSPVDAVVADLEDGCPWEFKGPKSRAVVVEAFNTLDFGAKVVSIRPNAIQSPHFLGDLEAIVRGAPNRFHAIVLPKASSAEDVLYAARLLDALEREAGWDYPLQISALIETPRGVLNAPAIATASPRMAGLVFGVADFAATLGIREAVEGQNLNFLYAKQSVVVAAKAAGLHAIDSVYLKLHRKDDGPEHVRRIEDGLRDKNVGAANLGMDGTWIIHPQQAAIANDCYTPDERQIAFAKRVTDLYHQRGGGSMADPETGDMIDEATIKIALMDLAKAVQAGTVSASYLAEQATRSKAITGYDLLEQMRRID